MTAVFLMHLAETWSKMCSAQGERSGQPNNTGSGQNRCAASVHCLARAPAIVKHEDRTVEDVKMHERAGAAGQKKRPSPSSGTGRSLLQDTSCAVRMMLKSDSSMTPNSTPHFWGIAAFARSLIPHRENQKQDSKDNKVRWRRAVSPPCADLLMPCANKKSLCRKYLCSAIFS